MKKNPSGLMSILLLILSAGMCLYGAFSGQLQAVLTKAINICLECIGIG